MMILTNEEQDLLDSVERGEWRSKGNLQSRKDELKKYAQQALINQHHFNVNLSEGDFVALQSLAVNKGIDYQLLAENILHRFINNELEISGL